MPRSTPTVTRRPRAKKILAKPMPPAPPMPTPGPSVYHIPHEHFIVALSFLVIALVGIVFALGTAEAQSPARPKTMGVCSDSDQLDLTTKGTVMLTQFNVRGAVVASSTKTDLCISKNVIREYYCTKKNRVTSKTTRCPKQSVCQDGACIVPSTVPSNDPNTVEQNPTASHFYPSDGSKIDATDGSWCHVMTAMNTKYCEDSRGIKLVDACDANRSRVSMCESIGYNGNTGTYTNTKCVYVGYDCAAVSSETPLTCRVVNSTASCHPPLVVPPIISSPTSSPTGTHP